MNRWIALTLSLVMLLGLTACGDTSSGGDIAVPTTSASTEDTTTTTATTTTTTTVTTTTEQTTVTTAHVHTYKGKITKATTCTVDGEETYTCSCGDSYTSVMWATGHHWSPWEETAAPTYLKKGTETRFCTYCLTAQSREVDVLSLEPRFREFVNLLREAEGSLGCFDAAENLSADAVFEWMVLRTPVDMLVMESRDIQIGDGTTQTLYARDYHVSVLDAFTISMFGTTFDYAQMPLQSAEGAYLTYDAERQVVTYFDSGRASAVYDEVVYQGYTKTAENQYRVTYTHRGLAPWNDVLTTLVIEVEMRDGNPVVLSHTEVE